MFNYTMPSASRPRSARGRQNANIPPSLPPPPETSPLPVTEDLVLALHDFDAVSPASNACLSFKSGQLIRVFNRDRSGWWDGEIVSESSPGASSVVTRGWFPSNYVSPISFENANDADQSELIRRPSLTSASSASSSKELLSPAFSNHSTIPGTPDPEKVLNADRFSNQRDALPEIAGFNTLLQPIMEAISLLEGEIHHDRLYKVQPATAYIISAVRSVLDLTNCLNRDSPILRTHPQLSRERKQILSVLACLVNKARKISASESSPTDHTDSPSNEGQSTDPSELRIQMKSILKLIDKVLVHVRRFLFVAQRCGVPLPTRVPLQLNFEELAMGSPSQAPFAEKSWPKGPADEPNSPVSSSHSNRVSASQTRLSSVNSQTRSPKSSSSSISAPRSARPNSAPTAVYNAGEMSRLTEQSHDQVLSAVAVFIGHAHLHSRTAHPSSHAHLIDMTRDVIEKVREMLVLVECIFKTGKERNHKSEDSFLLAEAREALYIATTSLVTAARVATSGPSEDTQATGDDEMDALLVSATSVLRAANDCMGALSRCLSGLDPDEEQYEVAFYASYNPPDESVGNPGAQNDMNDFGKEHSLLKNPTKRSQHTLSMLSRKASALTLARSQVGSEDLPEFSPILSHEVQASPSLAIQEYSYEEETESNSSQQHQSDETFAPVSEPVSLLTATTRSSSLLYQDDPRDGRYRSSSSGSSEGRLSRDSSPPTSASASHAEDELARQAESFHPGKTSSPTVSDHSIPILPATPTSRSTGSIPESNYSSDYSPGEVAFNPEGHVTGGTLRALVARMTLHDSPVEATFSHTFFMAFRMFSTPLEVVHALIARFALTFPHDESEPRADGLQHVQPHQFTPIRLRVYNVFKTWLENQWRMDADASVLPIILKWAETQLVTVLPGPAERLVDLAQKRLADSRGIDLRSKSKKGAMGADVTGPPPAPIVSRNLMAQLRQATPSTTGINLLDFDPTELARQITLIESRLYCSIMPDEILGHQSSKKLVAAVNVRAMSGMSTKMTGWITETILNEHDVRKRVHLLKFWVKLGNKLLELQNYNALMAVTSALNSSTITRLKKTWDGIGSKSRVLYESMNQTLSHNRNYAEYRAKLRTAQAPCIPFLGVYLTDMTFCHEGNPPLRASPVDPNLKLINFDRYQKMAKIVIEIERFQVPFHLTEVPEIISFISNSLESLAHKGSADSLYQKSLILEPREANAPVHPPQHHELQENLAQEGDAKLNLFHRKTSMS